MKKFSLVFLSNLFCVLVNMNIGRYKKLIKCVRQQSFRYLNATIVNNTADTTKTQDASRFLSKILSNCRAGCIYSGTGQYYQVEKQDRIVMLQIKEDIMKDNTIALFDAETLLDCSLNDNDVDLFMENLRTNAQIPVYNGEVDLINNSPWNYGFSLKPFTIFSQDERLLLLDKNLLYMSTQGKSDIIDVSEVDYVGVWISEEPYNEQKFMIGLKDSTKRIVISVEKDKSHCDLATLTIETEWLMKTAALLCVNISRAGNKDVHLRLSPCLQPVNNEWVAMRQKYWIELIQRSTWEKDF